MKLCFTCPLFVGCQCAKIDEHAYAATFLIGNGSWSFQDCIPKQEFGNEANEETARKTFCSCHIFSSMAY